MAQPSRVLFVALLLVETASVANCQFFNSNITQIRVSGSGLTCSNPSPSLFSFFGSSQVLSGAIVTLTCNGVQLGSTITDVSGNFVLLAATPPSTNSFFSPLFNCQLVLTPPATCTIRSLFQSQQVTSLRSLGIFPSGLENSNSGLGGQTLIAVSGPFFAIIF